MLALLFHSPEFQDKNNYNAKFKTPYQYAISSVRAIRIDIEKPCPIIRLLQQLDMPFYCCLTPDGYKNTEDAWLNPDAMTRRISFATSLANGRI